MSDHELADLAPTLSLADREALVFRYWRRGALTPLPVANSLARALRKARPAAAVADR